ncbi:MAG: hypothetical protein FWG68_11605 [Defluviitaleaceae bacterium]|nr:hypothetical protein [Defluviitaleaceae bacterium]
MATTELLLKVDEKIFKEFEEFCTNAGLNPTSEVTTCVTRFLITKDFTSNAKFSAQPKEPPKPHKTPAKPAKSTKSTKKEITIRDLAEIPFRKNNREIDAQAALESLWRDAELDGSSNMTMEEIDAEIALARKEERELTAKLKELRAATPWIDRSELREVDDMYPDEMELEMDEFRKMGYEVPRSGWYCKKVDKFCH